MSLTEIFQNFGILYLINCETKRKVKILYLFWYTITWFFLIVESETLTSIQDGLVFDSQQLLDRLLLAEINLGSRDSDRRDSDRRDSDRRDSDRRDSDRRDSDRRYSGRRDLDNRDM
jgi:hypothetical protein